MAVYGTPPAAAPTINGRIALLVCDTSGRNTFVEFLALAPPILSASGAHAALKQAYRTASDADPDEWTFDDVAAALRRRGFQIHNVAVWDADRDA